MPGIDTTSYPDKLVQGVFYPEEKLKFNFKTLLCRATALFLLVLKVSIQGRIVSVIVALPLNHKYVIDILLKEKPC